MGGEGGCVWSGGRVQTLVRYHEPTEELSPPSSDATQPPTTTQNLWKPLFIPPYTHIIADNIWKKSLGLWPIFDWFHVTIVNSHGPKSKNTAFSSREWITRKWSHITYEGGFHNIPIIGKCVFSLCLEHRCAVSSSENVTGDTSKHSLP